MPGGHGKTDVAQNDVVIEGQADMFEHDGRHTDAGRVVRTRRFSMRAVGQRDRDPGSCLQTTLVYGRRTEGVRARLPGFRHRHVPAAGRMARQRVASQLR